MEFVSISEINRALELLNYNDYDELDKMIHGNKLSGKIISYSIVREYIEKKDSEVLDKLSIGVQYYKSELRKKKFENDCNVSVENIERIIEHILLELPRIKQYNIINSQIESNKELNITFMNKSRELDKVTGEHKEKMEKMHGELVSMLSIFSAIIIAFFGGINLLGSALSNINNASKYRLICIVVFIGLIMFNIIYMLLHSVFKIIEKDMANRKNRKFCSNCNQNLELKCFIIKYPIAFCYNFVSFFVIIAVFCLYIIDKYDLISFVVLKLSFITHKSQSVGILGIIIISTISVVAFISTKHYIKKIHKKQEECRGNDSSVNTNNDSKDKYKYNFPSQLSEVANDKVASKGIEN